MKGNVVKRNKWDFFELREAYYYIDDISVRKKLIPEDSVVTVKKIENKIASILPDTFVNGQILEIKNINFPNGSAKLPKLSLVVMNELVRELNDHPFMEIQINGHTDN